MPKLVIKQERPPLSPHEKLLSALRIIVPVLLLVISVAAVVSWYSLKAKGGDRVVDFLSHTPPDSYTKAQQRLDVLGAEFEQISQQGIESYAKNRQLADKAEAILSQLNVMDEVVNAADMPPKDKQVLLSHQQFQKDDWDSKLHFHTLRLDRFKHDVPQAAVTEEPAKPVPKAASVSASAESPATQEPTAAAARALPPGVTLPPGMCPLFGPGAGECKAEAKANAEKKR